jgi:hypothetical protein
VLGDIRYTLETDAGGLIYAQSYGVRHGSTEVLARLARGEEVDAGEYTFRTASRLETAAAELDWLNKGCSSASAADRRPVSSTRRTWSHERSRRGCSSHEHLLHVAQGRRRSNSRTSVSYAEGLEFELRPKAHSPSDISRTDSPPKAARTPPITRPLPATSEGPANAIHEKTRSQSGLIRSG